MVAGRVLPALMVGVVLWSTGGCVAVDLGVGDPVRPRSGVVVSGAAATPPGSPARAAADARRFGRRVLVTAELGESREVYANADGTFTADLRVAPVRVRRGAGWVRVDTTLRWQADGSVGPVAAARGVVFSGGGDRPLVRLAADGANGGGRDGGGKEIVLRWPGRLPVPVLSGDTATYREVFPGVDLRMRARPQGFSKVLVVKNRAAATGPALGRVAFGLTTRGLAARADKHGNVGFHDANGMAIAVGAPLMWDSGGRHALGTLRLRSGALVLTPDRRFLIGPGLRFPLYIDPDVGAGRTGFGMVLSGYPNTAYWGGDDDHIAKVGLCPESLRPERECSEPGKPNIGVARSFFQFDTSFLLGRHVLGAEFNTYLAYTPSCVGGQVQVWATNPVDGGLTWNNQPWPGGSIHLGSDHLAGGYNASCPGRWLGYRAAQAVVNSVNSGSGRVAIMLKAGDEGQEHAWKKFHVNGVGPNVSVTYNTLPNTPTGLAAEGKGCARAPNEPHVNPYIDNDPAKGLRGPQLSARVSDPDGGHVYARFDWKTRGGGPTGSSETPRTDSGSVFSVDVPAAHATDGAKLSYRAVGADGIDLGLPSAGDNDPWCDVTIDRTAPGAVPTVSSAVYRECGQVGDPCPISGGIGQTGAFTLGRNGVGDVAGFRYDLHDQPSTFVAAGVDGTATALVTPPDDGPMDLFVRSVDKAGNVGPMYRYHFWVGPGTPPRAHWRLEGLDETAVRDDGSGHHDGTVALGPAAAWKAGRGGDALWLNGSASGFVATTGGRTADTTKSFTVAAWVNLEKITSVHTAVSQDGGRISGFFLQYNWTTRKWDFMMPTNDADSPSGMIRASSATPAQTGRWTHLAGVYDAGTRQIRLYVDGVLHGTAGFSTPWSAAGTVQLGRGMFKGGYVDHWPGSLDDVRVYDRVLAVNEVSELATRPAAEEVFFPLEEGTGTATVDASGNYRIGALGAGTSWGPGRVGSRAVQFDGQSGAGISTGTPVVRTDNSFTVSAFVKADVLDGGARTVVSQDGARNSGFYLQYRGDSGKWTFLLADSDTDNSSSVRADAPQTPATGEWVHLAGVYDAAAQQIRIYVGGVLQAQVPYSAPRWNATGPLLIGRAKYQNRMVDFWHGAVDGVHVWTGVRTGNEISDEASQPPTKRTTSHTGQLSRYVNAAGDHVVTTQVAPPGAHFENSLGLMAPAGAADTVTIYSCRNGAIDYFLALQADCAGYTVLGAIGQLYRSPPAGAGTHAVYACAIAGRSHFASHDADCEGQTVVGPLGYARAYTHLVRHLTSVHPGDHLTSSYRAPAHYHADRILGLVADFSLPDGLPLWVCRDGSDYFTSNQADCEGKTALYWTANLWRSPPGDVTASAELLRCRTGSGELFDSLSGDCEGHTLDRSLGFVITQP